jgi:tetratricopeptide (TPR) repeat protein
MSRMLNLVDALLSRSRHFQQIGRQQEARNLLVRLAEFRALPVHAAEEVQTRLAEIALRGRRFKAARRHLKVVLRARPDNARCHYLMGQALSSGSMPNPARALAHYRRALKLEPDHATWQRAYGLLLVEMGQSARGLRQLRRAVEVAPEDAAVLKQVVKGLRLANRTEEARKLVLVARFQNPHDARVLAIWNDLAFHESRKQQELTRRTAETRPTEHAPVILRFTQAKSGAGAGRPTRKLYRQDAAASLGRPHGFLRVRRPDQRHAQ